MANSNAAVVIAIDNDAMAKNRRRRTGDRRCVWSRRSCSLPPSRSPPTTLPREKSGS